MSRALVVRHHHSSEAGWVGRRLTRLGHTLDTVTLGDERPVELPDPAGYAAVVVSGSSHSVMELDDPGAPSRRWMAPELEWLAAAVAGGSRVLGICFGAQLMSRALGGTVTRMPGTQVGWFDVVPEPGVDPVFAGPWLEYHDDRFTVPGGATLLAADRFCPQAFTTGRSLAVQFHPEGDLAIVQGWVERFPTDTAAMAAGVDRDALLERTEASRDDAAGRADRLVDLFLALEPARAAA